MLDGLSSAAEALGVTIDIAKTRLRSNNTIIGAMLLSLGYADGMICGLSGRFGHHLRQVDEIIGKAPGCTTMAAMTHLLAAWSRPVPLRHARQRGSRRRATGRNHLDGRRSGSSFQDPAESGDAVAFELRIVADRLPPARWPRPWRSSVPRRLIWKLTERCTVTARFQAEIRKQSDPESPLTGEANVLVMPNLDAANISYNLLKMTGGDGMAVGPILLGAARPVHVLSPTSTVRRVVDMTALVVVDAASK
jgi:malate dehydrogenase (oxaloacetate-decarboxylating)(NADP+)